MTFEDKKQKDNKLKVFISNRESKCDECGEELGRVGRSAMAKAMDGYAVRLAVTAHVRHAETNYDELILSGEERSDARDMVCDTVEEVLEKWEGVDSDRTNSKNIIVLK